MPYDSKATLVSRLTTVRAAIDKARSTQSFTVETNTIARANFRALLEEEKWLLDQIQQSDATSTGGMSNRVQFGRPT